MTITDWISIGAFILSLIAIIFTWRKFKLGKKSIKLQEYNTRLNALKLAPRINIIEGSISEPYLGDDERTKIILVKIDNSGNGAANFPKWYWILKLKNNKEYNIKKYLPFKIKKDKDDYFSEQSYIPPISSVYENSYEILLDKIDEEQLFDTLQIWFIYKDIKNSKWYSYAEFKYSKNKIWTKTIGSLTNPTS